MLGDESGNSNSNNREVSFNEAFFTYFRNNIDFQKVDFIK